MQVYEGRYSAFRTSATMRSQRAQPDEEITYEFVLDRLCIYGAVNKW